MKTVFELNEPKVPAGYTAEELEQDNPYNQWMREAAVEIDRLKQQIRYQDQRDGRIGTHGPTCYSFGPHHYECALRKIEELESER
jgi:hypothetical protein